jgi:hypothetical protein
LPDPPPRRVGRHLSSRRVSREPSDGLVPPPRRDRLQIAAPPRVAHGMAFEPVLFLGVRRLAVPVAGAWPCPRCARPRPASRRDAITPAVIAVRPMSRRRKPGSFFSGKSRPACRSTARMGARISSRRERVVFSPPVGPPQATASNPVRARPLREGGYKSNR